MSEPGFIYSCNDIIITGNGGKLQALKNPFKGKEEAQCLHKCCMHLPFSRALPGSWLSLKACPQISASNYKWFQGFKIFHKY